MISLRAYSIVKKSSPETSIRLLPIKMNCLATGFFMPTFMFKVH